MEVSIREFEEITLDRLKLLHAIDRVCFDVPLGQIEQHRTRITKDMVDAGLGLGYPTAAQVDAFPQAKAEQTRRDSISHFALRLSFCKSHEARGWFVSQEQRLFLLRFDSLNPEAKEAFLKTAGVKCEKFQPREGSGREKDGYPTLDELQKSTKPNWESGRPEPEKAFYTMPFHQVHPSLIGGRKICVHRGCAYVPSSQMKMILASKFKECLGAGLDQAFTGLSAALSDPRVGTFLRYVQDNGMQLLVTKKSTSDEPGEKMTLTNFEDMLSRSMPPCMRRLVEKQRESKKHLKHLGRLQLRPFLKDCGFTLDESLRWWRQELCKDPEIDATSYEKNYVYDTEHAYGKKGHFQGQNSFGCPKIIGFPSEAGGQCHGCPFKECDTNSLKEQLHKWKVPESSMSEITKLIDNGKHYQLACVEYFKAIHPGNEGDGVGNSPGDFFRESCGHHLKKREKELASAAAVKAKA